jgi:TusA-related sulfurtransferase
MTGFTGRKNQGRGHTYFIDGVKVDGVTTILNNGLPKKALVKWAAKQAASCAVDRWDELAQMDISQRLKILIDAPNASRDKAAVRGTRVHALADRLAHGEKVAVPPELTGHVEACVKFLDEWDVEEIWTESPVFSRRWQYAGTLDLIAKLAGKTWLLDWKTSKSGAFGDTAFQLAAYRYAEFALDGNGRECPLPEVDECGVVWLRADGYDLYPYHADEGVFRQFLYIAQCARAADECRDYRGDALLPPVRTP